jgi:hypothetical protein
LREREYSVTRVPKVDRFTRFYAGALRWSDISARRSGQCGKGSFKVQRYSVGLKLNTARLLQECVR